MDFFSLLYFEAMELITWGESTPRLELQVAEPPEKPSLVVLLVNNVPWTDTSLGRLAGKFSVRAPRGHGLMAVIQILNLRSETTSGGSLVCKDYIKAIKIREKKVIQVSKCEKLLEC